MAVNIFDKYGIKEVANVYFEALENEPSSGVYAGDIVLFLDTLKVSTIETTAENVAAQGGWGNPRLVQWDYGKEITVTLTDALISLESLRFMLGGAIRKAKGADEVVIHHAEEVIAVADGKLPLPKDHLTKKTLTPTATVGHPIRLINFGGGVDSQCAGCRTQIVAESGTITMVNNQVVEFNNAAAGVTAQSPAEGDRIRIFWDEVIPANGAGYNGNEDAVEIVISPSTFPGTYKVVGDTLIRSAETGADEAFQFVINKAKVQSNVTITLEAEGDPSTFEMSLNVLRSGEDEMMKLVRYTVSGSDSNNSSDNDEGEFRPTSG